MPIGDRVLVIELNPFGECSGSALFDWKEDHDVLFGDAPFEIRVVEEPPDHLMERFTPWEDILKEASDQKECRIC